MSPRERPQAALLVLITVVVLVLAGCGRQIDGTAVPEGPFSAEGIPDDVLRECELVDDMQIAAAVGSDLVDRGFLGAICRWDGDGRTGAVRITFNWFENGSIDVERETNEQLGYTVADETIGGRSAIRIVQPGSPPTSCGTAGVASTQGVIGWWVHYRPGSSGDPCAAATTLLDLSFNRAI